MGAIRVNPYCIDHSVHTNARGQFLNGCDWVFGIEVDDLGSLRPSHFQSGRNRVDRNNPSDIKQLRASDTKLSNRSETEYRDRISWLYLGVLGRHVCSRNDVGEKDSLVIIHFFR